MTGLQGELTARTGVAPGEAFSLPVDHDAMVMLFADVQPDPELGHGHLRQLVVPNLQTTLPALSYEAIESRIPISGRVVAGLQAAKCLEPVRAATASEPYPEPQGSHRSYE